MKRKIKPPYSKRWKDLVRRRPISHASVIISSPYQPSIYTDRTVSSSNLYRSGTNTAHRQIGLENAISSKDNHQQRIIWLYNGPILSFNTDLNLIPRTFDTRRRLPLVSARQSLCDISDRYSKSIIDGESHFVPYVYCVWGYSTFYFGLIKEPTCSFIPSTTSLILILPETSHDPIEPAWPNSTPLAPRSRNKPGNAHKPDNPRL
jgi:hypothetical protein